MKKLIVFTILIFAFVLTGCNFPGFQSDVALDPDDAMATEIARILTGTPIQIEPTEAPVEDEIEEPETPEETEAVLTEPTEPAEPTQTPAPADTPQPTPTATLAETDPALTLGSPDWVDNMNNDDNWPTGFSEYSAIAFSDGFLKLTALSAVDGWRVTWPTIDDFYLEATLQTPDCSGNDHYGLMFRVPADSQAGKGYLFGITCDGRYGLRRWDGTVMHFPVNWTAHNAIIKGENVVNKLGVMAQGQNLALYINGQKVQEIADANYLEGKFGFFVGGTNVEDLTLWVDQVRYWTQP
ncbi:MAG: family 16 glycoside hydrolase [Brevefilum sp.]